MTEDLQGQSSMLSFLSRRFSSQISMEIREISHVTMLYTRSLPCVLQWLLQKGPHEIHRLNIQCTPAGGEKMNCIVFAVSTNLPIELTWVLISLWDIFGTISSEVSGHNSYTVQSGYWYTDTKLLGKPYQAGQKQRQEWWKFFATIRDWLKLSFWTAQL